MTRKIYFKSVKSKHFKELKKPIKGCWIHYDRTDQEIVKEVAGLAGIDYEDIKESLDIYELPRIEKEDGVVVIYLRFPCGRLGKFLRHTKLLTVIITRNYLITMGDKEIVERLKEKVEKLNLTTTQQTKFLLQILKVMSDDYTRRVRLIRDKTVRNTAKTKKIKDEMIIELLRLEEVLQEYILALGPSKNIMNAILTGRFLILYEEDADLLDDLRISVQQSFDICNLTLKNLVAVRDFYQIIFGNDLNRVMKFLAGLTAILTIPTIVSGIYGMNVSLPWEREPMAFWYILGGMLMGMWLAYLIFRKRDWL